MEEIGPFLFFIVIALVQLVKFFIEKAGKGKKPIAQSGEESPRKTSVLENFFEGIAEKLEPQPTPLPDWPENITPPNYMQEMKDFKEESELPAVPVAPIIPMPEPIFQDTPTLQGVEKTVAFQAPTRVASSVFAGTSNIRLPSIPLMKSNANGSIDFNLKDRKMLKQAIVANLVFSQPRAYDCSFDTTIAK